MKLLFISDIHGNYECMKKMIDNINYEKPDNIIILGDIFSYGYSSDSDVIDILNKMKDKLIVIRGNCDKKINDVLCDFKFYDNLMIEYNNKKIFLTHGHIYNMDNLPDMQFDIMLHGHFHMHYIKKYDNKIFASPGSISMPRNNSENSYMVIEDNKIVLKNLDRNIILESQI
ncbi:MAG: phosphodiesterase [Bacilli bacterium]